MGKRVEVGVSIMLEPAYWAAIEPLLEAKLIDVIEWSFDFGWGRSIPDRVTQLLADFSQNDSLLGHGVTFSPLSGRWSDRQEWWLDQLRDELRVRPMRHISEHFGYMEAGSFHQGSPLPVPMNATTLAVGVDRLKRLADATARPVGLENLAFAFSQVDAVAHGEFSTSCSRRSMVSWSSICTTSSASARISASICRNTFPVSLCIEFEKSMSLVVHGMMP